MRDSAVFLSPCSNNYAKFPDLVRFSAWVELAGGFAGSSMIQLASESGFGGAFARAVTASVPIGGAAFWIPFDNR